MLGYLNGESWDFALPRDGERSSSLQRLEEEYGAKATHLRGIWGTERQLRHMPWRNVENLTRFVDGLLLETAPLVQVTWRRPLWLDGFERWLPYDLPLRSLYAPAAPDGVHKWKLGTRGVDRCFCRYVTQPRYIGLLSPRLLRVLRRAEADPPGVALHLRTMVNHLPAEAKITRCLSEVTPLSTWLRAACEHRAFERGKTYVMTDSPRLLSELHRTFSNVRVNPMLSDRGSPYQRTDELAAPFRKAIGMSRAQSWDENKLFLAIDFHLASLSEEIQTERWSSFALPIMARSMCVRRTRFLCGERGAPNGTMCPMWGSVFSRQMLMFLDTGQSPQKDHYFECFERHLPEDHPCKNHSNGVCREAFVSAAL